jgi:hypothetical protein
MNARYLNEVQEINKVIKSFNEYLGPTHRLPEFNFDTMLAQKHCIEVVHGDWNAFGFPNSEKRGVYFIFAHEQTAQQKNGLYIGKASFGSAIGRRLYAHLHPSRSQTAFTMKGYHNEVYVLDYMASIDLDSCSLPFMSSSFEEFAISKLSTVLNLINGTGNWGEVPNQSAPIEETILPATSAAQSPAPSSPPNS